MRPTEAHDPHMTPTTYARRTNVDTARPQPRPQPRLGARHGVVMEGVLAGTLAATGVALAYFLRDLMLGDALFTPALLGAAVGRTFGVRVMAGSLAGAVGGYAILHYAAFIAFATVVAAVVRRARRDATVLAAALLVTSVAELLFIGFVTLLGETTLTAAVAWPQLATGNVIGWLLVGGWMWRAHPELRAELTAGIDGTGSWPTR